MIDRDLAHLTRRRQSRLNAIRGEHAQVVVAYRLKALGLECVAHIETGWHILRRYDPRVKRSAIIGATPKAKVECDITAVVPGTGQSVRCEVKKRGDDALSLSDFETHQRDRLTLHAALGGLSLVGWSIGMRVEIMDWPRLALVKGEPLKADDEERIAAARWKGVST